MSKNKSTCQICGNTESSLIYNGPIRLGRFSNISSESYSLYKCIYCEAIALPNLIEDMAEYYENETYRQEVDAGAELNDFHSLHDGEQLKHLSITGTSIFRNKIIADIGCGAGSFLDLVSGQAQNALAIEPATKFRNALEDKGYITYPYVKDALKDYQEKVDIAVSFSVIEHIEEPLTFLKEIRMLLGNNGKLIVSTPNAHDLLLESLPEDYPQFFYRKAHLWYFNPQALKNILEMAGYKDIKIIPYHRFGLGNFIAWIKNKSPKGNIKMDFITPAMENIWKTELERTLKCDYLFAEAIS